MTLWLYIREDVLGIMRGYGDKKFIIEWTASVGLLMLKGWGEKGSIVPAIHGQDYA